MTPVRPTDPMNQPYNIEPEYDFRKLEGVVRGKYAARYGERLRIVRLDPDVSAAFADEQAVNDALRDYLNHRKELQAAKPS